MFQAAKYSCSKSSSCRVGLLHHLGCQTDSECNHLPQRWEYWHDWCSLTVNPLSATPQKATLSYYLGLYHAFNIKSTGNSFFQLLKNTSMIMKRQSTKFNKTGWMQRSAKNPDMLWNVRSHPQSITSQWICNGDWCICTLVSPDHTASSYQTPALINLACTTGKSNSQSVRRL